MNFYCRSTEGPVVKFSADEMYRLLKQSSEISL